MQSLRLGKLGRTDFNPNIWGKAAKKIGESNHSSNIILFLSPKTDIFIHSTNNGGKTFRRLEDKIISSSKKYPVGNKKLYLSDEIKNDKSAKKSSKPKSKKTDKSSKKDSSISHSSSDDATRSSMISDINDYNNWYDTYM